MQMIKKVNFDSVLTKALNDGIITLDDVMDSDKEDIMATILDTIHNYKITQSGGRYTTYVKDETKPNGIRQVRKKSKTDLFNFLIDFYDVVKNQKDITFEELYFEWIGYKEQFVNVRNVSQSISTETIRKYKSDYKSTLANTDLANMSIHALTAPKFEMLFLEILNSKEIREKKIKNILGYLNQMFAYAKRSEYVDRNIMEYVDTKRLLSNCIPNKVVQDEDRVLTSEELHLLRQSILRHEHIYPHYMPDYAIELAMLTGMRVGELSALHWSDIKGDTIYIHYSEHRVVKDSKTTYVIGKPKNGKYRTLLLTKDIRDLLQKIKDLGLVSKDDFIFVRENGQRYTAHDISCAVGRRAKEAGFDKTSIHEIRRTFSSELNKHIDQTEVASMLGHSVAVNDRHYNYATANKTEKIKALEAVSDKVIHFHAYKSEKEKAE